MRTSANKWNDACKYGPWSEPFFCVRKQDPNDMFWDFVSTPLELNDFMWVVEQESVLGCLRDHGLDHRSDPAWTSVLKNTNCLTGVGTKTVEDGFAGIFDWAGLDATWRDGLLRLVFVGL